MFSASSKKPAPAAKTTRRCHLQLEQLERRDLMSVQPVVFSTLSEGTTTYDFSDALTRQTGKVLPVIATSPMMESQVSGRLTTGADVDMVKVRLEKGQILTTDLDFTLFGARSTGVSPKLRLLNSAGQELAQSAREGIGYRITQTGDYYLSIGAASKFASSTYGADYTLHIRPVGLADNDLDPIWLQRTEEGIYVWQDGNMLNISGPVGHGFSIRGNWQQTTNYDRGLYGAACSTQDPVVYIQTSLDNFEIPVISDGIQFSVTTKAGKYGKLFGELKTASVAATTDIIGSIVGGFGDSSPFGLKIDWSADNMPVTLGEIGMRLGNDPLMQATGAPLNPAVPYLFINASAGINATYEGSFAGLTYSFGTLIVDPSDPFAYFSMDVSNAYGIGVGLSHQGLIPFYPEQTPTAFTGQLFGHVYVSGEFTLPLPAVPVPVTVEGSIVLNLNGHGTGAISRETTAAMGSVSSAMSSATSDDRPTTTAGEDDSVGGSPYGGDTSLEWWRNFSIGINGSMKVGIPLGSGVTAGTAASDAAAAPVTKGGGWLDTGVSWLPDYLGLELASASVIYDGPNAGLYFRGGTDDFLDDTLLDFLTPVDVDIDGAWLEGGKFFLNAEGEMSYLGLQKAHGQVLLARKFDLPPTLAALINGQSTSGTAPVTTTGGYVELGARVLGSEVTLKGRIQSDGDFELVGQVGVNIGLADAAVTVKFRYDHVEGINFTATLTGNLRITDHLRANVTVNFMLGVNANGNLIYAGSGSAKLEVKVPHVSWKGVSWKWEDAGSVGVGVSNDAIWFNALGHNIKLGLPH